MKKIKRLISGMFLLCLSFLLAGCLCDKKETYNVDFIVDNEVISTKEIQEGDKASAPVNPTKTGYDFVGWYIGETKFDFSTKINEELDLVAKFELTNYNLTIDLMGGQIEGNFPITSTYTIEDKVTLPTPTRDNFIFLGWQESGSADVLATVVLDGATGNKSYTAIYEYADHRIPLYIDGILYKSVPVALGYKIMDLIENLDDTTLGWFKDEALYDAVLDNDVITENMKLYTKKYNGEDNSIFLVYQGFVKVNADSSWNGVIPKKIRGQVIKGIKEVNVSQTTKIYLPNSVTFINSSCLSDDGEFGNLPNTIASIGNVNVKVNSVSSIEIRKENISIEGYAFHNMTNLEQIEFENNSMLETIGNDAFYNAIFLKTITIPASVKTIGDYAFSHSSLSSIKFENNSMLETIGVFAFNGTQIDTITIPASVKTIGDDAFYNSSLSSIEFENNSMLETIGDSSFRCTQLDTITIPASVKTIGNHAFGNGGLSIIEFENNSKLETIGDYAFRYAPLETIIIPLNVQEMGINSFDDNTIVVINYQNIYELIDNDLSNVQQIHVLKTLTGTNIYLEENYNKTETEDYWIYTRKA